MRQFSTIARHVLGFSLCSLLIGGYALAEVPSDGSTTSQVLQELGELRNEIFSLRKEVGLLRQDIQRNAPPARPSAPPPPDRLEISHIDPRTLGAPEATVGIVEFTDYQCPFCQRFHAQTFPSLKETYIDTGKVLFVPRDFPLGFHEEAESAAITTRCAAKQGKFWPMREGVFEHQIRLGTELYQELATKLDLDLEAFSTCQEDPHERIAVNADLTLGGNIGISGTPGFFVGRIQGDAIVDIQLISGALPFAQFSRVIDSLLP